MGKKKLNKVHVEKEEEKIHMIYTFHINEGETVVAEDPVKEQPCQTRRIQCLVARDEVRSAGKAVANDPDRVVAVRAWKLHNEIHRYGLPRPVRDLQGAEQAIWLVTWCLDAATDIARLNIAANVSLHAWPREVAPNKRQRARSPGMA